MSRAQPAIFDVYMNRLFPLLVVMVISMLAAACIGGSTIGPASPTLKRAAQKVAERWGGEVSWQYTVGISTKKGRHNTLTVTIERSNAKALPDGLTPEFILNSALWLMYQEAGHDLNDDDLFLKAVLKLEHSGVSSSSEVEYPLETLRLVAAKAPLFARLSDALMHGDAEAIRKASLHELPDSNWQQSLARRDSALRLLNMGYTGAELLTFDLTRVSDYGTPMPALSLTGILKGSDSSRQLFSILIDTQEFNTGHYLYGARFGL